MMASISPGTMLPESLSSRIFSLQASAVAALEDLNSREPRERLAGTDTLMSCHTRPAAPSAWQRPANSMSLFMISTLEKGEVLAHERNQGM